MSALRVAALAVGCWAVVAAGVVAFISRALRVLPRDPAPPIVPDTIPDWMIREAGELR